MITVKSFNVGPTPHAGGSWALYDAAAQATEILNKLSAEFGRLVAVHIEPQYGDQHSYPQSLAKRYTVVFEKD